MRALVREHSIKPDNLVYPIFIEESDKSVGFTFKGKGNRVPIASMPGIYRHDLASMMQEIQESVELGIKSFVLFPHVAEGLKNNMGSESYNPNGIVPRAIKMIKAKFPHVVVITDVALDPYSSMGHDGVVEEERILNDITVQQLQKQAVMHARAGADMVSPSDMMDGRIGAIRDALDSEGFSDVGILSYSAKYASAFYGPFRDALDSHPGFGDKKTYQMDPSNSREATTEALLDVSEGADMLMVKPGMPYLDVIRRLHSATNVPIAAYQVSGEYAMLKAAAQKVANVCLLMRFIAYPDLIAGSLSCRAGLTRRKQLLRL
jgi:porphobilinogen synthase